MTDEQMSFHHCASPWGLGHAAVVGFFVTMSAIHACYGHIPTGIFFGILGIIVLFSTALTPVAIGRYVNDESKLKIFKAAHHVGLITIVATVLAAPCFVSYLTSADVISDTPASATTTPASAAVVVMSVVAIAVIATMPHSYCRWYNDMVSEAE